MENPQAFPMASGQHDKSYMNGMTMLDYFAAHAPTNILWEFKVPSIGKRPEVQWPEGERQQNHEAINWKELQDYDLAKKIQIKQMWPWEWAKAMLKSREEALKNL